MSNSPRYGFGPKQRLEEVDPRAKATRVDVVQPFEGLQDNNYGNSIVVKVNESLLVLRAHGRDDIPSTVGLSMGYRLLNPEIAVPFDVAPVAILRYGTGGANVEIEMDLLSGMVLNVPATSFDLSVANPSPLEPVANFAGSDILVQASFGVGSIARASINPARRTIRVGQLAAGIGTLFPIPTGAVGFNVYTTTIGGLASLEVSQSLSPVNSVPLTTTVSPIFDNSFASVSIVSGARGLQVLNSGGAPVNDIRVVFTLAF